MKTLNLLQNMSAEAKVLAMALPMLLLGAMSAMSAVKDPGRYNPSQMDMHFMVTQPDDTARVKPVDWIKFPEQNPKSPGLDAKIQGARVAGVVVPRPPVPSDSANIALVDNQYQPLPSEKPEGAGLDNWTEDGVWGPIPMQVSPDSASVEPAQKPEVDKRIIAPMPHVTNGEPEEDGLMIPANPGEEDVYEKFHIAGIDEVAVDSQPAKAPQGVFTLSGLRVSESADLSGLAPGLYIVNGKKILVK